VPAKNDDAVCLQNRAACFAGKPRSYKDQSTGPYKSGVRVALSVFRVKEKPPRQSSDRLELETVLKRLPYRAGP
jgi:hypothetical protein